MRKKRCRTLTSSALSRSLDIEASAQWGLNPFALVEAAGRACAQVFVRAAVKKTVSCAVCAGSGNNAADALVMLRALILDGSIQPSACTVYLTRTPDSEKHTPLSLALLSVQKLGVTTAVWGANNKALAGLDLIIDGITGTGLESALNSAALEMTEAINSLRHQHNRPFVVSIDIPSGNFDLWQPGMPIVTADATLAIEPQKLCLYTPAARPHAGAIFPVGGIFPAELCDQYGVAELVDWKSAARRIPQIPATAHKYERGLVEIRAGSPGSTGAARLAALGAQAAGAGLVRLIVDPSLYPLVAPACSGIMAAPDDAGGLADGHGCRHGRFLPAAVLLGPGWGKSEDRKRLLEDCLPEEKNGRPLILDADAIALAQDMVFHGNALLTPHPGEFAAYTGIPIDEICANPIPVLRRFAAEKKATILFKSHVLYVASADGRIGIIDGMNPLLASGGSGDVLAGFCAGIAARMARQEKAFDGYTCACAAASLLVRTAHKLAGKFIDPAELADAAAAIAGAAWLPMQGAQQ